MCNHLSVAECDAAAGTIDVDGSGFDYNGESNLDLQYAMSLVGKKQNVTLYQVGDAVQGKRCLHPRS